MVAGKKKRALTITLSVLLAIILLLLSGFAFLYFNGKSGFHKNDTAIKTETVTPVNENEIEYGGKTYILNKNIVSVLFIGIDKERIENNEGYGINGQADSLFVAAVDTFNGSVKVIPISRETMVDVDMYDDAGEYAGIRREQICLAYAFGNNAEKSSKNVLKSVRRTLYNINISSYVTVDMRAVERLTVKMGGVTVPCLEEITVNGKPRKTGENLLLKGKSATEYIRTRGDDAEANNRRMERQKQFLSATVSTAGNQIINDFSLLMTYYNTVSPYMDSNLSASKLTYLASLVLAKDIGSKIEYKKIEGRTSKGEKWIEFEQNEQSVTEILLDVFYTEKT